MTRPLLAALSAKIDVDKPHEVSFPVCATPSGDLFAGEVKEGTPLRVMLSTNCFGKGTAVAAAHTHLEAIGGMSMPSEQDVEAARRMGMPKTCIIQPESRRVLCFDVK